MKRSIKAIIAATGAAFMCAVPTVSSVSNVPVINSISASAYFYPNLYEDFDDSLISELSDYGDGTYGGYHMEFKKLNSSEVEVTKLHVADSRIKIPAQVKINGNVYNVAKIGDRAFQNKNGQVNGMGAALTKINLSSARYLREIGDEAFQNCTGLTDVTIPASVEKIGTKAFQGSGIQTLRLERTSAYSYKALILKDSAFANCTSLRYITNNVTRFTDTANGVVYAESNPNAFNGSTSGVTVGTSYRIIGWKNQFVDSFKNRFGF